MNLRIAAALLCAAALSACGDKTVTDITAAAPGARIKFFNFGVNAPQMNFYANGTKITAISSTSGAEATTGTAYGAVGNGGFYSGLTPGQYTLSGKVATTTDNGLAVTTVTSTLADGKYYSMYVSGIYDGTAKSVESFVVEDPFSDVQDFTVGTVRFVNAISNSQPMTLYLKDQATGVETPIGGPVAYKSASAFVKVSPTAVYDLIVRNSGSTATAITRTSVGFPGGRVSTVTARGDMTVTSTTATNRPFLDLTLNR